MTLVLALAPVSAGRVGEQAAKTAIIVIVLLVGFRVTGKRGIAQFNIYDLAVLMALSNAGQNAMTGGLGNLPIGLATTSTVVIAAWALSRVLARRPQLEQRVLGTAVPLVNDGRVIDARLRQEHVSREELDERLSRARRRRPRGLPPRRPRDRRVTERGAGRRRPRLGWLAAATDKPGRSRSRRCGD